MTCTTTSVAVRSRFGDPKGTGYIRNEWFYTGCIQFQEGGVSKVATRRLDNKSCPFDTCPSLISDVSWGRALLLGKDTGLIKRTTQGSTQLILPHSTHHQRHKGPQLLHTLHTATKTHAPTIPHQIHRFALATMTPDFKPSTTCKPPNSYHHLTHIIPINKNNNKNMLLQHNNTSSNKFAHNSKSFYPTNHRMCNNHNQTNKSSNLLHKARLHAQKWGDKSNNLKTYQNTSNLCVQQMASRGKAIHDDIMKSPIDTTMEDAEDMMVVEANQIKRTQIQARKQLKQT